MGFSVLSIYLAILGMHFKARTDKFNTLVHFYLLISEFKP